MLGAAILMLPGNAAHLRGLAPVRFKLETP